MDMESTTCNPPILHIEDNPVDIDLTLRAFARYKLANSLLVAREGEEALAWTPRWEAGETKLAVILLDLNLPRIYGLTVLKSLKNHPKFRDILVIVLATSKENRDISKAYELGVNSHIVKPVDFDNFMEVAQQIELYWCVYNGLPK